MHTLTTERLVLRAFAPADAPLVEALAGEVEVAQTTNLPHPYPPGAAVEWIEAGQHAAAQGQRYPFAIVRHADGALLGGITLWLTSEHQRGELGYWVGRPYWGQGYATEAAARVVAYAFEELGLRRVTAQALRYNRASTRVMEKVGMLHEGTLRQHIYHWGAFKDVDVYGVLRPDAAVAGGSARAPAAHTAE
jgi:RimJ/RimL family protein N-acetyltransferase